MSFDFEAFKAKMRKQEENEGDRNRELKQHPFYLMVNHWAICAQMNGYHLHAKLEARSLNDFDIQIIKDVSRNEGPRVVWQIACDQEGWGANYEKTVEDLEAHILSMYPRDF